MVDLTRIKLFAMDVDGTLTDGHIYMGSDGEMMKAFHVKDGLGLKLLMANHIVPAIITGRTSTIVENRCREIGITEIYQGIKNKRECLLALQEKYHLDTDEVAYIGDDMNDISAIKTAGITFAPADCARDLKPYVDIVLTKNGGDAPVREAIDMILSNVNYDEFYDL